MNSREESQSAFIFLCLLSVLFGHAEQQVTESYLPLIDSLVIGDTEESGKFFHENDLNYDSMHYIGELDHFQDPTEIHSEGEVPDNYLQPENSKVFATERPRGTVLSEQMKCQSIHCYIKRTSESLDCLESFPRDFLHDIQCSYFIKPLNNEKPNQKNVKIFLRTENTKDRKRAMGIEDGAIKRLLRQVKKDIEANLEASLEINFSLSITYIHFKEIKSSDFLSLIGQDGLVSLSLWNPKKWSDIGLMPTDSLITKQVRDKYFRLNIYCEESNKLASFQRLWLPFKNWSIKLNQCSDFYVCRKWSASFPVCYQENSTLSPEFVLYPDVKSEGKSINSYVLQKQTPTIQTFSNSDCKISPQVDDDFKTLIKDDVLNCWHDPIITKVLPVTAIKTSTTTTSTTTTTNKPSTIVQSTTTTTKQPTSTNDIIIQRFNEAVEGENLLPSMLIEERTGNDSDELKKDSETTKGLIFAVISLGILNFLILLCLTGLFCWFSKYLRKRDYKKQPNFPSHYNNLAKTPKKFPEYDLKFSKDTYVESFNSDSTNINSDAGIKPTTHNPAMSQLTCNTIVNSDSNSPQITPKARSIFLTKDFSPVPQNDYTKVNSDDFNAHDESNRTNTEGRKSRHKRPIEESQPPTVKSNRLNNFSRSRTELNNNNTSMATKSLKDRILDQIGSKHTIEVNHSFIDQFDSVF